MTDVQPAQRLRLTMAIALAVIAIDQLSKHWAVNALTGEPPRHVFWTLQWNLSFNSGMAFSKGQGIGPIIGLVAVIVVVVIMVGVRKNVNPVVAVAAGFVVGGALGNLADRVFRGDGWLDGSVIDFIDFQWFPIFNVADMGVNIGGALFVIWSLFSAQDMHATPAAHVVHETGTDQTPHGAEELHTSQEDPT
jgi:signal peptidase II